MTAQDESGKRANPKMFELLAFDLMLFILPQVVSVCLCEKHKTRTGKKPRSFCQTWCWICVLAFGFSLWITTPTSRTIVNSFVLPKPYICIHCAVECSLFVGSTAGYFVIISSGTFRQINWILQFSKLPGFAP